jgi:hypothetical protein
MKVLNYRFGERNWLIKSQNAETNRETPRHDLERYEGSEPPWIKLGSFPTTQVGLTQKFKNREYLRNIKTNDN